MTKVADKLREARALIAKGWVQQTFGEQETATGICYCAMGAILEVAPNTYGLVCTALKRSIGGANIFEWNDHPERTQAEVLAAFDKAIELAEASE